MAEELTANQSGTETAPVATTPTQELTPTTNVEQTNGLSQEVTTTPQVEPTAAETFEIKYNGEAKKLTKDELIAAAQKGLDYDRIRPEHDFIKELAEKSGIKDVSAYIESARAASQKAEFAPDEKTQLEKERDAKVQELVDKGQDPELALDFANRQMNDKGSAILAQKQQQIMHEGAAKAKEEALNAKVSDLEKKLAEFTASSTAKTANTANAAQSIGAVASVPAQDKDFYTHDEFVKLPQSKQDELTDNGKLFGMMPKWE